MFIPKIASDIGIEELLALFKADKSNISKFSKKLCQHLRLSNNLLLFNRGRSALSEALKILGVKPEDEVIIPAFCCRAVVESVINCNAIPVLLDVDPKSMVIDIEKLSCVISSRTKVVIVVKTYGLPISYEIFKLINNSGLLVILDSAHSLTLDFIEDNVLPDAIIFSFGFDKPITTGYGGALWIKDRLLLEKYMEKYLYLPTDDDISGIFKLFLGLIHSYATSFSKKYIFLISVLIQQIQENFYKKRLKIAHNTGNLLEIKRMGRFAASIGLCQLYRLPNMESYRLRNAQTLYNFLKTLQIVEYAPDPKNSPLLRYPILLKNNSIRDKLLVYLKKFGIGANISVWPEILAYDPWVKKRGKINFNLLLGAIELTKKFLLLPVHPKVHFDHLEFIINIIEKFERDYYENDNKRLEELL